MSTFQDVYNVTVVELQCSPRWWRDVAQLSCSTTQRCDHCLTFMFQSEPSMSELHGPLRGKTRIVGVWTMKPIVLKNFNVAPRHKMMRSCGKFSSNFNGTSFNRNLEAIGLHQPCNLCRGDSKALWSKLWVLMSSPTMQHARYGLASGLLVTSSTGCQCWKPSLVSEPSVTLALLPGTVFQTAFGLR